MNYNSKDQEKKKDEPQEKAQVAAANNEENVTLCGALRPREEDNVGSKEAMATGESMACLLSSSRVV